MVDKYYSRPQEYTVEAGRPDTITREKLRILRHHNVGRISINPQTLNQKTLDLIGRNHTVEMFIDAFKMAREEGFKDINTDIILGLPGEGEEEVTNTLKGLKELGPESITVHTLAVKRASRLDFLAWQHFSQIEWVCTHIICTAKKIWLVILKMLVMLKRVMSVFTM